MTAHGCYNEGTIAVNIIFFNPGQAWVERGVKKKKEFQDEEELRGFKRGRRTEIE